jgi:uncharacterized protein (TIGR03435 family)
MCVAKVNKYGLAVYVQVFSNNVIHGNKLRRSVSLTDRDTGKLEAVVNRRKSNLVQSARILLILVGPTISIALAISSQVQPKQGAGTLRQFEVASVKPNNSDRPGSLGPIPRVQGDRFLAGNTSLAYLIKGAFQLHDSQLIGAPDWIYSERWDIEARADVSEKISRDQMLTMLQRLLIDRFRLRMHREMRQVAVYELVMGSSGHKLQPVSDSRNPAVALTFLLPPGIPGPPPPPVPGGSAPQERVAPGSIIVPALSMSALADLLSFQMDRPVIDRTRLSGNFKVNLTWMPNMRPPLNIGIGPRVVAAPTPQQPDNPAQLADSGSSIFTAAQEQLGLKLESSRATVEVMVIDSVTRPDPN